MEESNKTQVFNAEWDDEGVFVYQAFKDSIADWALENQQFGGPDFNPRRMTWIKPSFAWVLYRSGYARKHHQTRILKIKLSHEAMAYILSQCACGKGGGGHKGRVQWDPERDMLSGDGKEPNKIIQKRAIQIGMKDELSEFYVQNIISIQDVTELAHKVQTAHSSKNNEVLESLIVSLPVERPYIPSCSKEAMENLGMLPGEISKQIAQIGKGKHQMSK